MANDCFLHQHAEGKAKLCGEQASLLDLVFKREERDVINIKILPPLGLSDHGMVCGDLVAKWVPRKPQMPRRLYHKGYFAKINAELNKIE